MWCLPTHKRPEKLARFIASMQGDDKDEEVLLMLWQDDPRMVDYQKMQLPKSWTVHIGSARTCGEKMNRAFQVFPFETFYGLLTDDVELATPNMLVGMRALAESGKFAWPNDGIWGEKLATHPVAPGNMIRSMGCWAHPRFQHNHIDSVLFIVAQELGILHYCPQYQLKVTHPAFGTAPLDETYTEAIALNHQAIQDYDTFVRVDLVPLVTKATRQFQTLQGVV